MNQITTLHLSELGLLSILIVGLALFAVFRGAHHLLVLLPAHRTYRFTAHRMLPVLEAVAWLIYALWGIEVLFVHPFYHTLAVSALLTILAVWVSWFAVKDWTAGFVLRTQDVYERGQTFQLQDIRGRILHVGFLSLEIEQQNGDIVKIPYSRISGQIHSRPTSKTTTNYHRFQVTTPHIGSLPDTLEALRAVVLQSPWSSTQKEPLLTLLQETDQRYTIEVLVYAPRPSFAQAIEEDVKLQYPDRTPDETEDHAP